jgi:hypothetical protein
MKLIDLIKKFFKKWFSTPTPEDTKPAPPVPPPDPFADAVDPALIAFYDAPDAGSWKKTARISAVRVTTGGIFALIEGVEGWVLMAGNNPERTIGNWWIGTPPPYGVASTAEWLGQGKTTFAGRWDTGVRRRATSAWSWYPPRRVVGNGRAMSGATS